MKDLPELHELIRPMWSSSYKWRENKGSIEFALDTSEGDIWFPICMAPVKIETFVRKWRKLGNLNEIS